ncbi:MAG: glycosyltransferase [Isosphaeraceae bacterium]
MRIGFDMLAVQSPHHGHRGIGRYSANLLSTLLSRNDDHQYVLYVHDGLADDRVPRSPRAMVRRIESGEPEHSRLIPTLDQLARTNPDNLDLLVVLSPFEKWSYYSPPARDPGGLPIAAVVYDLIPFLFQNELAVDPELVRHYRTLEELTRYDVLLAISQATRRDCLSVLGLPEARVVNISGASNGDVFQPAEDHSVWTSSTREALARLGITRAFLFNVGGLDPRKNTWKLIEAYALLPRAVRNAHQLVLTFSINSWGRDQINEFVRERGLTGDVIVTGEVSDSDLTLLYQHCAVFAFPSTYEGFGLPILEAMHCGAPVVAGNNSSQIEVVGDAGLLAEAGDPCDLAAKLARVVESPALSVQLRRKALEQAGRFSWQKTADQALQALTAVVGGSTRIERPRVRRRSRPALAFFSPLPPRKSGIADYSHSLLEELRERYEIDLYHDAGYVPETALGSLDFRSCDYRLFDRMAAARDYHGLVYQMGNSHYHGFMFELMLKHPGVITLHDFCLAGFHLYYGHSRGKGYQFLQDLLVEWYPEARDEIPKVVAGWPADWEAIARDCARRGWYVNRHILDAAEALIVHSPWCKARVAESTPAWAERTHVVPLGSNATHVTSVRRAEIRRAFDVPSDAVVVASFGFIHRDKMCHQALEAFAQTRKSSREKLVFLFVGEDADAGRAQGHAGSLSLGDSVRFLGRQPAAAFQDLMAITDIAFNLRLPPTNGETSAALLALLAAGVPTIVTDVATFSDYPSDAVRKVRWESEGQAGLTRALMDLVGDPVLLESLGRRAWNHVDRFHSWPRVASLYAEVIEAVHEQRMSRTLTSPGARPRSQRAVRVGV